MDSSQVAYKGLFNNHYFKNKEIIVYSDGVSLSFRLEDLLLISDFEEFILQGEIIPSQTISNKLKTIKISYSNSEECDYAITDYSLEILFPFELIPTSSHTSIKLKTWFTFNKNNSPDTDSHALTKFNLKFDFNGDEHNLNAEVVESLLIHLQETIRPAYKLKNCFGCLYSDYWPAGNQSFGNMLCFREHKREYLKVKSKTDIFRLMSKSDQVQETHRCDEFEIRKPGTGYRG